MIRISTFLGLLFLWLLLSACEPPDPSLVGAGPRPANAPPPSEERLNEERAGAVRPLEKESNREELDPERIELIVQEFVKSLEPPAQPASWTNAPPSASEYADWARQAGEKAAMASAQARQFHSLLPDHPLAEVAKRSELEMLRMAVKMGAHSHIDQLEKLEMERAKAEGAGAEAFFEIRFMAARNHIRAASGGEEILKLSEIKRQAESLIDDFPNEPRALELLWLYGEQADGAEAIRVAERIKESSVAPEKLKREARALLIREDPQGRDFPIVFESADGRRIDGESLKGRKVLLHFWATWSPEAIGQFALLKQMLGSIGRDKLAVLSFNMDLLKSDFQKVIDEQSPDWPQQFDGEGYQNAFAKQVGVEELPACVLLDEQGRILVSGITTNLEEVLKKQFNID